ncbi:MAG TPA: hypothetical protein VNO21_06500 [Polyangiaceae bacterium]|nr:hypothetical protein [Polyangiaceae bacterium]
MSERTREYLDEIRAYLFGRLSKRRTREAIAPHRANNNTPDRILSWWIFEGKRYRCFDGPLAANWEYIKHEARRLLQVWSPEWREARIPEGEVDWTTSAILSLAGTGRVYRVRSTQNGLSDQEQRCLIRWMSWIRRQWHVYATQVPAHLGMRDALPWNEEKGKPEDNASLRNLAQVAAKSRWPLLRDVIAETLRHIHEPNTLFDAIPLPKKHAQAFQLLCMTRMLRVICPEPEHIRWIDPTSVEKNTVVVQGCSYTHEHSLAKGTALKSEALERGLRDAMARHGVHCPERIDGFLKFDTPLRGFTGILVEAKSGAEEFKDTVHQLRFYRAAMREIESGPLIIWGITEQRESPEQANRAYDELKRIMATRSLEDEVWVFSGADDVERITSLLLGYG